MLPLMHGNRKHYAEPGQRFGRLTVIRETRVLAGSGDRLWGALCSCDCGRETEVSLSALARGAVRSCGCLNKIIAMRDMLLRFLRARLDEDEAEAASRAGPPGLRARQRREITAKRCIIAAEIDRFTVNLLPDEFAVLFALASIWDDHPGYRQEWAG